MAMAELGDASRIRVRGTPDQRVQRQQRGEALSHRRQRESLGSGGECDMKLVCRVLLSTLLLFLLEHACVVVGHDVFLVCGKRDSCCVLGCRWLDRFSFFFFCLGRTFFCSLRRVQNTPSFPLFLPALRLLACYETDYVSIAMALLAHGSWHAKGRYPPTSKLQNKMVLL